MQALEQNTQEWLDYRKDKIGASDMPIILGISPYCTPYELWRKKLGFSPEDFESYSMKRGKELEPLVRNYMNEKTDYYFTPKVVNSSKFDWAMASLDGVHLDHKIGLEIKCTSEKNHKMIENGICPDIFYPQIQWQMECGELDQVILAHMFVENIVYTIVKRDDSYIQSTLIPAAKEFHRCLIDFIPPEATEKDYVQIIDKDFGELAKEWIENNQKIKELKQREELLKRQLIDLTDDGNCKGFGILIKKKKRQGSVDWNQLWERVCEKYKVNDEFNPEKFRKNDIFYWDIREEKIKD